MNLPFGYVYRITNNVTGYSYVGQRKLTLDKSWRQYLGSGKLVKEAIVEFGESNFTKTLLGYADSPELLNLLEEEKIAYEKDVLGAGQYNIARFVNGPNIAGKIGSAVAVEKMQKVTKKHYADFLARNQDILIVFEENPTDLLLANALNEPLVFIKKWMQENELTNSLMFSGQVKNPKKPPKSEKRSESSKRMWSDPEKKAAIATSHKGKKFSDEHRANLSKSHTRIKLVDKQCLWCNIVFTPKKSKVQFCSLSCASYARHRGIRNN